MRPIDNLREKIDLWKKSTTDTALMSVLHDVLKQIDVAIYEMDHHEAESTWHRVEDNPPKPGCYLTASPFFHGYDYSWLYRLARWTEHGLMDFVQDAEKESGWYIWNNSQDRDTEIEPMYWMPIEPPKEIKNE